MKAFQFRAEKSDNQISCGLPDWIPVVWLNDGKHVLGGNDVSPTQTGVKAQGYTLD